MSHEKSTALASAANTAIAAHLDPASAAIEKPDSSPRSLRPDLWRFGDAMIRHNAAWLTGGVIGFVSFLSSFFFTATKIPPMAMAVLSFLLIGKAAFNVWREQRHIALDSQDALEHLGEQAGQLRQRIFELEHPQIQASVESLSLVGEQDLNSPNGDWSWTILVNLEIVPPLHITVAITSACGIVIDTEIPDSRRQIMASLTHYWDGMLMPFPKDIKESGMITCDSRVTTSAWDEPLPDVLIATVRLSDARSKWSSEYRVKLHKDRTNQQTRWIGWG